MRKHISSITFALLLACQPAQPMQEPPAPPVVVEPPKKVYANYGIPLPKLLDSLALKPAYLDVLVLKGEYELVLMLDTVRIKSYPIVLGGNPVDDKLRQGDQCTPEGVFGFRDKYPHRSWTKFIWIDYPSAESRQKHKAAKAEGRIPKDAAIGGDVGIHGIDEGFDHYIDERRNWTLGCVSMKNADVNEIYPYIKVGKSKAVIRK